MIYFISICYQLAGKTLPTNVRAHSIRAQTTALAYFRNIPIAKICKAATSSNPITFVKHYGLMYQPEQMLNLEGLCSAHYLTVMAVAPVPPLRRILLVHHLELDPQCYILKENVFTYPTVTKFI